MYLPESREQSATLLSDFFPQHQCASSLEVVTMGVNLTPALQHACYLKPSCVHLSPPALSNDSYSWPDQTIRSGP